MKLFFWRRKPHPAPLAPTAAGSTSIATATALIERSQIPTHPLAVPIELRDAMLRFALDCLVASGARVRVEADDLISAVLPDGASVRYTTSLARARAENDTELLVQGGAALAKLLDECAVHAAVASLRLEAHTDPLELARTRLAVPAVGCGDCTRDAAAELCKRCPLRTEHLVLAGLADRAAPRVSRRWMGRSVELTYVVAASDRHGRRDEEVRVAFDAATGSPLPLLSPDALAGAQTGLLPGDSDTTLKSVLVLAERALAPQLHATGALLRLLAEREYRARLDDIRTTSQRLLRESPDDATTIHAALDREIERLREVFAIHVDARLASICFVERPMATLTIPSQSGASIELEADLASGTLLPPACAACAAETRTAFACSNGHLLCPTCQQGDSTNAAPTCPVCAGAPTAAPLPAGSRFPPQRQGSRRNAACSQRTRDSLLLSEGETGAGGEDTLSLTHLDAMSAASWRLFVAWLLAQEGYHVESAPTSGVIECWACQSTGGEPLLAGALRPADRRSLSMEDVERLAAQHAGKPASSMLLMSTAPARASVHETARRLGVRLLDRAALAERLGDVVGHHLHEREAVMQDQQARAEDATATRAALLAALHHAEGVLASAGNTHRAAGRSAVAAAASTLADALAPASRALLAWETLMHDWAAAFDEREARGGSLIIRADGVAILEMAERARHLGAALAAPLGAIAATPGVGDLGYTVWRRDILEHLSAQCEAYRWRVLTIDPSQWQSFTAAHDALAGERASSAEATAAHAATRAARSYAELARRAHIVASTA